MPYLTQKKDIVVMFECLHEIHPLPDSQIAEMQDCSEWTETKMKEMQSQIDAKSNFTPFGKANIKLGNEGHGPWTQPVAGRQLGKDRWSVSMSPWLVFILAR